MISRPIVCRRLIGRDADLAFLHERRRDAGNARGSFVLVSGEPGIGKTRLLAEFRDSLVRSRMRVAPAGCVEFAPQPYGPVRDLLARFPGERAAVEPALSKREQFDAIADAFVRLSVRATLVLIIEDLHWADGATVEFLTYFAPRLRTLRILIIASYRAGALPPDHPAVESIAKLANAAAACRIELAALDGPQLRVFIDEALAGTDLSTEARRTVALASDGIPFYVEELLRSAVDRGSAAAGRGAHLPTTFRAALLERLRPFDAAERGVLAQAAVIGRSFDVTLLAQTLNTDGEMLLPVLRRARDVQLIEESESGGFRFRHALTREAIYGDFLDAELRALHRKIALAIEALPVERQNVESLAYHWWAAHDPARAAAYGERAGDAAARVHAHDDAIAVYGRALESLDGTTQMRARVLEKIARHHVIAGYNDRALAAYIQAAAIYETLGRTDREAEMRVRAAVQDYRLGGSAPTAALSAMLERIGTDDPARSRLHLGIAHVASLRFRADEAARHLDAVDPHAIEANLDVQLSYRATRAMVSFFNGDIARFETALDEWLALAASSSDSGLMPLVHYNGGVLFAILGRHDGAMRHFEQAIALARERRDRMNESAAHAMSAMTRLFAGDLAGARAAVLTAFALPTDSAVALWHAAAWGTLAALHLDDDALVRAAFDDVETRVTAAGAAVYAAGFAEIMVRRGRDAEARALLHRAIDYGERPRGIFMTLLAVARFGDDADLAHARSNLVRAAEGIAEVVDHHALALFDAYVAQREGDDARAAERAASAVDGLRRLGYPLLEAAALELAGERGAALAIYRRTGAVRDVKRLAARPAAENGAPEAQRRNDGLSAREVAVATLVARGLSNREIGNELAISHKTVEKHLGSIYQKLGFSSRPQLAAYVSASASRS